jgi:DNA-binding response OmpR family regulator
VAAKRKILIIEDEKDLALGLRDAFEFEGWSPETAERGAQGIELAKKIAPDLFILDLMLPDMNGFQVCSAIRERYKTTPILILSARSQENDIIRGLETGADDYVTKPFSIGELLARVRAIFRRADLAGRRKSVTIAVGDAAVNVGTHTAKVRGHDVDLGFYATAILQLLDEHRGEPVTRDEILDAVWGMNANPTNRTVDNFIMKLRRKLEVDPAQPRHILTVYGQGYKLI